MNNCPEASQPRNRNDIFSIIFRQVLVVVISVVARNLLTLFEQYRKVVSVSPMFVDHGMLVLKTCHWAYITP